MKKFIYTIIFAVILSVSFTACTEDNVKPANDGTIGGGGNGQQDPITR